MKLWKMSESELEQYWNYCIQVGNLAALSEINDFKKYYGKVVEVIKGRKVPIGTTGIVFYVERFHYAPQWWKGWSTRIGFKDEDGTAFFTDERNLQLIR